MVISKVRRRVVLITLGLSVSCALILVSAGSAVAAPGWGSERPWGYGGYLQAGRTAKIVFPVVDKAVCADDRYDLSSGRLVDVLRNNLSMAWGIARVQSRARAGVWRTVARKEVLPSDIAVTCEPQYVDGVVSPGAPAQGDARLNLESGGFVFGWKVPAKRQWIRVVFTGAGSRLVSGSQLLLPTFRTSYLWWPGPYTRKALHPGFRTVDVRTDARLAGVRAFMIVRSETTGIWNPVQMRRLAKRGKSALTRLEYRSAYGRDAFVCIDYQQKFPLMSTGNSCPSRPVDGAQLEASFPGSTARHL